MAKDVVEITAGSDEHHNGLRLEIPTKIKIIYLAFNYLHEVMTVERC